MSKAALPDTLSLTAFPSLQLHRRGNCRTRTKEAEANATHGIIQHEHWQVKPCAALARLQLLALKSSGNGAERSLKRGVTVVCGHALLFESSGGDAQAQQVFALRAKLRNAAHAGAKQHLMQH